MICVSLVEKTRGEALQALARAESLADLIEIRLDALESPEIDLFLERANKSLLFTYRAREEGGLKESSLEERLNYLNQAAQKKAFAVDLELASGEQAISELKRACQKTKLLLSFHNFQGTPAQEELKEIARQMKEAGADLGKIVTYAREPEEALIPLSLISWARKELSFPLIAFAMGEAGCFSRVVCLLLGSPWTYAALPLGEKAAPGQLRADTLRSIFEKLKTT
ncbi:3-dehydroquinate dehydratase, type I [Thermodesulfatator indicus DSM 15286]|uniref:3-dehydroquinate dehydratase n=1 Tax=Thermodesulfatator indicus (strain DSM 15286 / JCM 11887 / CIR29812) TaxID=667014 RepID=F8AAA6_THEID|nr:type I 3-dehydroquinate dehydratase [Thermodesulfatator indicus]AEH44242.1 3-dehydroquinate dehydratase, type I [Thermodesulfatator indicus DSM 15286]